MQIKWLRIALKNLDSEAAYIAKENPAAAQTLVRRIIHAISQLESNPALSRPGRVPGTRELIIADTPYLIPYRVQPRLQRIEILRVFHTARRPRTSW